MSKPQAEPVGYEAWAKAMQKPVDGFLRRTWDAMQAARDGHWIEDTEETMRSARDPIGQVAYETLLGLQIERTEASFSPSGGRGDRAKQGATARDASDHGGPRAGDASGVVAAEGGPERPGG